MKNVRSELVWRYLCNGVVLCSVLPFLTAGCRTSRPVRLLGPRAIVPAPYVEPTGMTPAPTPPAFEALPPAAIPGGGGMAPAGLPGEFSPMEPITPEGAAAKGAEIVLPPDVESQVLTYTVKKGDSLWEIARMYGITHPELAAFNQLDEKSILKVGQNLRIPPGGHFIPAENRPPVKKATKAAAAAKTGKKSSAAEPVKAAQPLPAGGKYEVKTGDSLWKIAHDYGLKTSDIRELNNLKTDVLQVGQVLVLPTGAATSTATKKPTPVKSPVLPATPIPPKEVKAPEPVSPLTPTGTDQPTAPILAPPVGQENIKDTEKTVDDATVTPLTGPQEEKTVTSEPLKLVADPLATFPKKLDHLVSKGETLQMIAEMYGTTTEAIINENPQIKTDADLKPGAKIMVPYR